MVSHYKNEAIPFFTPLSPTSSLSQAICLGIAFEDLEGHEFFPIVGLSRTGKVSFSVCAVEELRRRHYPGNDSKQI